MCSHFLLFALSLKDSLRPIKQIIELKVSVDPNGQLTKTYEISLGTMIVKGVQCGAVMENIFFKECFVAILFVC